MAIRPRPAVVVVVLGLVAVAGAAVLSIRPSLDDARRSVDAAWADLEPVLGERYERAEALAEAVAGVLPDSELVPVVADTHDAWRNATASDGPSEGAPAASRMESAAARLAVTSASSPRLVRDPAVAEALRAYLAGTPTAPVDAFNDSVRDYDSARRRFPGAFFADFLGYEPLRTVEIPGVLAEVEPPEAPAPEEPPAEDGA